MDEICGRRWETERFARTRHTQVYLGDKREKNQSSLVSTQRRQIIFLFDSLGLLLPFALKWSPSDLIHQLFVLFVFVPLAAASLTVNHGPLIPRPIFNRYESNYSVGEKKKTLC